MCCIIFLITHLDEQSHIEGNAHLNEQSLYVFWYILAMLFWNHIDHKCIVHLHETSLNVFWDYMTLLPSCLEVALITSVPYISMNRVHMVFEISFPCCLVITLITSILHISMSRVYMCFETYFPLCAMLVCPTLCNLDVHWLYTCYTCYIGR